MKTENGFPNHVISRKLRYFGNVMRLPCDSAGSSAMLGLVAGTIRRREIPRRYWMDNKITTWTGLSRSTLIRATRDNKVTIVYDMT